MVCKLYIVANSSSTHAVVGDILSYKIIIKNESEYITENIVIKSLLSQELKFIYESVEIDHQLNEDLNIISGIEIGTLMPGDYVAISFNVEVMKKIKSNIEVEFNTEYYWLNENERKLDYCTNNSSAVRIYNPSLKLVKTCNKKNVQLHEVIDYEIKINNNGDLDLYNIIIKDILPNALELIDGSFMINNNIVNSVNLSKGITIDTLKRESCIKITYKTKVVSGASGGKLINKASARYSYTLDSGIKSYKESPEVINTIKMLISNFKQVSLSDYIYIDCQLPSIDEINEIKAQVNIEHYNVIKTPVAISKEGQKLSGYKLVVHGNIEQVIEYISLNKEKTVNSHTFQSPFSTYIILPEDFVPGTNIELVGFVEKISANKIDKSSLFRNAEILIIAKVICYK